MFYKITTISNQKYLLFSDLHILHNNIFDYEPDSRKIINKKLKLPIKDNNYYKLFSDKIFDLVNKEKVDFIINLWDFFFNLWKSKYKKNKSIIDKRKKLNMLLILWNHDVSKPNKVNKLKFDEKWNILNLEETKDSILVLNLFKVKAFHIKEDKNNLYIFTHYPLGSLKANWQTYWFFYNIEQYLLDYISTTNKKIINFHWHIHSKKFVVNNNIEYLNICIDYLVK